MGGGHGALFFGNNRYQSRPFARESGSARKITRVANRRFIQKFENSKVPFARDSLRPNLNSMLFSWRTWHPFFGNNRYQNILFALEEGSALKAMRAPLCQVRFELGKVLCIPWHSAWHSIPIAYLYGISFSSSRFVFVVRLASIWPPPANKKRKGCKREAIRKLRTVQTHSNTKSSRVIKHERL